MANTLTASDRYIKYEPSTSTTGPFPADFPVFDTSEITVLVGGVETSLWTATAVFTDGVSTDFSVTLNTATTSDVEIVGDIVPTRDEDIGVGSSMIDKINKQVQKITATMQEMEREIGRSIKVPLAVHDSFISQTATPVAGAALIYGPSANTITSGTLDSGLSTVTVTGATESRVLGEKLFERVSVLDYGPVGTSDDAATFEAAITAANASAASGFVLFVPPGTYNLPNGLSVDIARHRFYLWAYAVTFVVNDGTAFTWGDGTTTYNEGGLIGCYFMSTTPAVTQKCIVIDGHSGLVIRDIQLSNINQFAQLGTSASDYASGITISRVRGSSYNQASALPVIDIQYANGATLENIKISNAVSGTTSPTDRSADVHGAVSGTTFIKMGTGSCDTFHFNHVVGLYYDKGLHMVPGSGVTLSNGTMDSCYMDLCKSRGMQIDVTTGSVITLKGEKCWFVGVDGHSFETTGNGTLREIVFVASVARQAGMNNWKMGGNGKDGVALIHCAGMGANRISTNTGPAQDDLYVLGTKGITVIGGRYGLDGQPYTGISGNQARYGVQTTADMTDLRITGTEATGATAGWTVGPNTATKNNSLVAFNGKTGALRPEYAATTTPTIPTTGTVNTWFGPTRATITLKGGNVTTVEKNGVVVWQSPAVAITYTSGTAKTAVGSQTVANRTTPTDAEVMGLVDEFNAALGKVNITLNLMPNDTWEWNGTTAPTMVQEVLA